jgi:RND family efflux transporter MFP subunit
MTNTEQQMGHVNASGVHGAVGGAAGGGAGSPARQSRAALVLVPLTLVLLIAGGGVLAVMAGVIPTRRDQAELAQRTAEQLAKPPRMVVAEAKAGPESVNIVLPARVEAVREAPLYPRESGYLAKLLVDIGDRVKAGQTLAMLETPVLDQELHAAEANIRTAEARVAETDAQLTISRSMLERLRGVNDARAISPQDLDDANGRVAADGAAQQAAKAALESARASLKQLNERKSLANIVAPFDGEIGQRGYDAGALVIADKTDASRPIFTLTDRSEIRAFVDLPQSAAVLVRTGQPVELTVRELRGQTFKGEVVRASASMTIATRTRLVESRIANPNGVLLPGMFGEVRLSVARDQPATVVPGEAILMRGNKSGVAVIGKDGRISYREVTIGRDTGVTVEILSGVSPGERVAVSLARQPDEGTVVDAVERDAK